MDKKLDRIIDGLLLTASSTLILIALTFAVKYLGAQTTFPVGFFIFIAVLGFSIIYRIIERKLKKRYGSIFITVNLLVIPSVVALIAFYLSVALGEKVAFFQNIFQISRIFLVLCALIIASRLITYNIATVFGTLVSLGSSIVYIAASLALYYLGQNISKEAVPFTLIIGGFAILFAYMNVERKLSAEFNTHWGYSLLFLLAVPTLVSIVLHFGLKALDGSNSGELINGLTEKNLSSSFLILMLSMFSFRLLLLGIMFLKKKRLQKREVRTK